MLAWLRRLVRVQAEARELDPPFLAEVVLDGVTVAALRDRVVTDMFWRSYHITPVGDARAIYDDALWDRCRFTFRDPASGALCTSGFVGGRAPFVRDGRVLLRALYFEKAPPVPRMQALPPRATR